MANLSPQRRFIQLHLALACSLSPLVNAADHVLIMTISDYPSKPLAGVRHDAGNALNLARKLGYDTQRATVLKDRQLEFEGFHTALRDLAARVQTNDRVFLYYSGHGASRKNDRGVCEQALVSRDEQLVSDADIEHAMEAIKDRLPQEVMVVFDACHSGGLNEMVVMRSAAKGGSSPRTLNTGRLESKLWVPKSGESCQNPVNFTKAWTPSTLARSAVNPEANFTFIAAANQREVALDDRERGGLATTSLIACLDKGVPDSDGSQSVSMMELVACAQRRINTEVPRLNSQNNSKWMPHVIEVSGNQYRSIPAKIQVGAVTQLDKAAKTRAVFSQIAENSNGNWSAEFHTHPIQVKLGEKTRFVYQTNQPGYASMLYVGSDNKDIRVLLENQPIAAGIQSWSATIQEPAGTNTFLAIVSQRPLLLKEALSGSENGVARMDSVILKEILCTTEATRGNRNIAGKLVADDPCLEQKRNANALVKDSVSGVSGYTARVLTVVGE